MKLRFQPVAVALLLAGLLSLPAGAMSLRAPVPLAELGALEASQIDSLVLACATGRCGGLRIDAGEAGPDVQEILTGLTRCSYASPWGCAAVQQYWLSTHGPAPSLGSCLAGACDLSAGLAEAGLQLTTAGSFGSVVWSLVPSGDGARFTRRELPRSPSATPEPGTALVLGLGLALLGLGTRRR